MIFFLAFHAWLANANHEIRTEGKQLQAFVAAQASLPSVQARLMAIREARLGESIVAWIPKSWTLKQEVKVLSTVATSAQRTVDEYQKSNHGKWTETFERLSSVGFLKFYVPYMIGTFALTVAGYALWYRRVQLPSETLASTELELKNAYLRKVDLEIKQIQRARFARKVP